MLDDHETGLYDSSSVRRRAVVDDPMPAPDGTPVVNNNGSWWIHYTEHPTPPLTKCRHRASLGTSDVEVARARRDAFLKARRFDANATPFAVAGEAQNDRDLRRRRLHGTAMRT